MRILLVNDGPIDSGHGAEASVRALYQAFKERGHDPFILTGQVRGKPFFSSKDCWAIPDLNAPPLRKSPVRNFVNQYRAIGMARDIVRKVKPDIIHVHNLLNPFSLRALRRLAPTVKSIHDCRPFCAKPPPVVASRLVGNSERFCSRTFGLGCWSRCYSRKQGGNGSVKDTIERWSFFPHNFLALKEVMRCDKIVVYSEYLQQLASSMISKSDKIELVYHFVDFKKPGSGEPAVSGRNRVLFVGRLSYEKGVMHLLESVKQIPEDFEVVIIGDGPMREVVQNVSKTLDGKKIKLLGYVPHEDVVRIYRDSSFVVFSSIGSEGCPIVGLEALANGKPVVGFDVGGVGEWLIDGQTGYLVPRGDVRKLTEGIQSLLSDNETAKRMGQEGIKLVRQKFSKEIHISRLLEIYANAIEERRRN